MVTIRTNHLAANIHVYTGVLNVNEEHRDQWKENDEFIADRMGFSDKLLQYM